MDKAPSCNGATYRKLTPREEQVRALSERLVEAQRPIRILDAVKWGDEIEQRFFERGARDLPAVREDHYRRRSLPFNPQSKLEEFREIESEVQRRLGSTETPGRILLRMCWEYRRVVEMLLHRGTPAFGAISRELYGSAQKSFPDGLSGISDDMHALLNGHAADEDADTLFDSGQAVAILASRLTNYFQEATSVPNNGKKVRVCLSDGIVADAAAGCDYLKIRRDARFRQRELRLLEVHEGWVHLGTTINGQAQPVCTFLSKGPPSSTITQEGLAVLMELVSGASCAARVHRLTTRSEGVARAEQGADFLDVYRFFLEDGTPRESYQQTMRIFRGSLPAGQLPFTKDLCYCKGFRLVLDFVTAALENGNANRIPHLFCGKAVVDEMDALAGLVEQGLVAPARHVPAAFGDADALRAQLQACHANGCWRG